jgi:hypothetical protein
MQMRERMGIGFLTFGEIGTNIDLYYCAKALFDKT